MDVEVLPAEEHRWPDVKRAFGRAAGRVDSCWCQRFTPASNQDNPSALRQEMTTSDPPVGLLAYVDGTAAGWTRVVPRVSLPGITGNRALQRVLPQEPGAWWVSCFVVRREHRGAGVGTALLLGAVDWAQQHGASAVQGHPVDTAALTGTPSPSAIFTGTLPMFLAAGFVEVARTYPSRPVMHRDLSSGATGCSG